MTYGNGVYVEYQYDDLDRIVKVLYNGSDKYGYAYNSDGSLYMAEQYGRGYTYYYNYDGLGRLIGYSMYTNGVFTESVDYGYDEYNRANTTTVNGGENQVTATYTYNNDNGTLTKLNNAYTAAGLTRSQGFNYTYDGLLRLNTKKLTHHYASLTSTYGYADNLDDSQYTSNLVDEINYKTHSSTGNIFEFDYAYDRVGNIKSVTVGGNDNYYASGTTNYFYDKQNQLVMEVNDITDKTYLYEYDTYGNLRKKYTINCTDFSTAASAKENMWLYTYTTDTYTYGNTSWKDQLTAYNGAAFTYDAIGNPTKYNNGKSYTFQWQNGRELYRSNAGGTITFYAYGENGLRTIKNTNGGEKYLYYYAGEQLISQVWDDGAQSLNFLYDENGSPYGFVYDDGIDVTPYFYIKNVQGDVVAIMGEDGTIWATYNYDAWGNILSIIDYAGYDATDTPSDIGNINPIRYRGYYYDNETGFYYLGSRYYDPSIGRFINGDIPETLSADLENFGQYNLYAYCWNNPVNLSDDSGTWPSWAKKMVAAVAVVAVVATAAAIAVGTAGSGAAISCMLLGAAKGAAVGLVSGAVSGAASGAVSHRISTGSWDGAGQAALDGMADGALSGAISGAVTGAVSSPYCFVAGTAVLAAVGYVAIENIVPGDIVYAWNETTDKVELKRVVETYINETDELIHLHVNGEEIITTPSHPFYSPIKGWTDAVYLRAGDILVLVNGEYVVLEKVQHEILEKPVAVYNFQVEDDHTYYVGESGVLVHNSCRGQLKQNMLKQGSSPGTNYQAHHGLPWKNRNYFKSAGLDVNDARFGRWVRTGKGGHQSWSRRYGKLWDGYISNHPTPDASDIVDYFNKLNGVK